MGKHRGGQHSSAISDPFLRPYSGLAAPPAVCTLYMFDLFSRPLFLHHWSASKARREGQRLVCSQKRPTKQHHYCGMGSIPIPGLGADLVWSCGCDVDFRFTLSRHPWLGWGCLSPRPLLLLLHHLHSSLGHRGGAWPTRPGGAIGMPHAIQTSATT